MIMIKFVNAKINLGLNIVRKRPDRYHELETIFYPVGKFNGTPLNPEPFCDILEVTPADGVEDYFEFSGNPIDCPLEKNLVYKALQNFRQKTEIQNKFSVRLHKNIPDGAGLGGGSADASFMLLALNESVGEPLSKQELIEIAKSLGADCPFFIENRPVLATGIGEIMRPAEVNLSGLWVLIVKPDVYISTKEAFAGIIPSVPEIKIDEIISRPIEEWEERGLKNDFEPHIFRVYPELADIKHQLQESGAVYSAMSGSGSSFYGIYREKDSAAAAAESFDDSLKVFICKL